VTVPLRIALTVEQLWQPVPGGSGTYIVELASALVEAGEDVRGIAAAHRTPLSPDLRLPIPVRYVPLPRRVLYDAWNGVRLPRAEHVVRGPLDVVHATTWAIPPTRRPLAVTVHDVAFLREPGHFTQRGVRFFTRALERTKGEADVVIVPSQATATDCVDAGIEPSRIVVVPHGVRVAPPDPLEIADFREASGLDRPYLLWTGTREPRKNLAGLLAAFELVAAAEPDVDLVLAGPKGWGDADDEPTAIRGRVHHLGRLTWPELQLAYAGARAFCFPSLWEGFGMPVLEAMGHAVPVVTSAGTSMAEVVGDAGLLVDPKDPADMARALLRALGPDHDRLADAGLAVARRATWQVAGAATVEAYRGAITSHG
jgi:glycosyltransferase involved in cell wall biosynthesis